MASVNGAIGASKCALCAVTAPTEAGSWGAFRVVSLAAFVKRPQADAQIGAARDPIGG